MIYYTVLYILFLITVTLNFFNLNQVKKIFFLMAIIFSILILSFKGVVGGYDLGFYSNYFKLVGDMGNIYNYEIGYYYFNKIVGYFSNDSRVLFGIIGFFFILSHACFSIKIDRKHYPIIVFLLFLKLYLISFTYFRQIIAISFYIWGVYYIFYGSKLKSYFFLALSVLFHSSLFLGLVALFINKKIFSKGRLLLIYIFSTLLAILLYATKLASSFYSKLEYNINIFYIIESFLVFLFLYVLNGFFKKNKLILFYNLAFIFCVLDIFAAFLGGDVVRILWIFNFAPIICIVFYIGFIKNYKPVEALIFLYLVVIYFTLVAVKYLYGFDDGVLMNYVTIFNDSGEINNFSSFGGH